MAALVAAGPLRAQAPAVAPAAATPPSAAATAATSAYTIGGIAVDVVAGNADTARETAYRIAQRAAWPQLWERITGQGAASAPRLEDGALDSITSGIEIQGERFSTTRYIATLGVVFDRTRAQGFFTSVFGSVHSEPMLLLPLLQDAGTRSVYDGKTPWAAAWERYRDAITPLDYVLASNSVGDTILLTGYQMRRPDRALWRNILNRFKAVDVLVAEVKLTRAYPGGPIDALFIARHGPDGSELGRFGLRTGAPAGLDAMLDTGVRQIDAIYGQALRNGRLRAEPDLSADMAPIVSSAPILDMADPGVVASGIEALVATPDSATWLAMETALRATPGVTGVTLTSLSLGGSSRIVIRHSDTRAMLEYELDQKALRLAPVVGGVLLRRREPGEVPMPRPVVVVPEAVVPAPVAAGSVPLATPKPAEPKPLATPKPVVANLAKPAKAETPKPAPVDLLPR